MVDKALEIENGHDGAWVAHPGMVEAVLAQFQKAFGDTQNPLEFFGPRRSTQAQRRKI